MDIVELRDGSMVGVMPNGHGGYRFYYQDGKAACNSTMQDEERWSFVWDTDEVPDKIIIKCLDIFRDRPRDAPLKPMKHYAMHFNKN